MRKYLEIIESLLMCFIILILGSWLSDVKDKVDVISFRIGQIEKSVSASSEEINSMKKELVILDSVCDKVLNHEW